MRRARCVPSRTDQITINAPARRARGLPSMAPARSAIRAPASPTPKVQNVSVHPPLPTATTKAVAIPMTTASRRSAKATETRISIGAHLLKDPPGEPTALPFVSSNQQTLVQN